jgi:hypothetical protein
VETKERRAAAARPERKKNGEGVGCVMAIQVLGERARGGGLEQGADR